MQFLDAEAVRKALPMAAAIEAMRTAFAALSDGRARMPVRSSTSLTGAGVLLTMPAVLPDLGAAAVKVVSVQPGNPARGLPTVQAQVLLLDVETGAFQALLEGTTLTAIRTGAASGLATELLARPDARVAAILGSGVQARTQLEAVCTVRKIEEVRVYSPTPAHREAFAAEMAGQGPIPDRVLPVASAAEAVRGADVICCATTATEPIFDPEDLSPGVHINAVGAYTPRMREVPTETVQTARVFVDHLPSALEEAGDLLIPIQEGRYQVEEIAGELGEVVLGRIPGRLFPEEITLFKSVGVAVQDVAAAWWAVHRGP